MSNKDEDKETLKELREITKTKENWGEVIDDVANKLNENHSVIVKAKILWLLGEMGLNYPKQVEAYIIDIAFCLEDEHPKIRERAVNALGRIGRADKNLIIPYLDKIMKMRKGAAVGGGVSGIIFLAIIIFVIVKIIYPKLSGAKDEVLVKAYAVELEGVFKDIQRDYLNQGNFRELKSMMSVK